MITSRSATAADLPAITELQRRWDTAHLGAPEHDEREVAEAMEHVPPDNSRLVLDGDRLVGVAYWWGTTTNLFADPDGDQAAVDAELLDWMSAHADAEVQILDRDTVARETAEARGWHHHHSSVELIRTVTPDWQLEEPDWPAGVEVRSLQDGDAQAVHHLIYREAGWTEIPGHPDRTFGEWRSVFLTDQELPEQQVLAWRDGALVGASIGRTWSDGTGWVSQLAVARAERGQGLGRALLLESLRRRVAGGATALGLSVEVVNQTALGLYLSVGLVVDREWMTYARG